jgi:hypothetical protein
MVNGAGSSSRRKPRIRAALRSCVSLMELHSELRVMTAKVVVTNPSARSSSRHQPNTGIVIMLSPAPAARGWNGFTEPYAAAGLNGP